MGCCRNCDLETILMLPYVTCLEADTLSMSCEESLAVLQHRAVTLLIAMYLVARVFAFAPKL